MSIQKQTILHFPDSHITWCKLYLLEICSPNDLYHKTANRSPQLDLDPRPVLETQLLFETQLLLKHCQPGIPG